jgi:hypothetical protein
MLPDFNEVLISATPKLEDLCFFISRRYNDEQIEQLIDAGKCDAYLSNYQLLSAIFFRRSESSILLQKLVNRGLDIHWMYGDNSTLHMAAYARNVEAVRFLLSSGVNALIQDAHGRFPLNRVVWGESSINGRDVDEKCFSGILEIVNLLIVEGGNDPRVFYNFKNSRGSIRSCALYDCHNNTVAEVMIQSDIKRRAILADVTHPLSQIWRTFWEPFQEVETRLEKGKVLWEIKRFFSRASQKESHEDEEHCLRPSTLM